MSTTKGSRSSFNTDLEAGPSAAPDEAQQTSDQLYPNYSTTLLRILLPLLTTVFLFMLWALPPSKTFGIIAAGTEYIGAVARCSGTTCEDWLKGGANGPAVSPTTAPADPPTNPAPTTRSFDKRAEALAGIDPVKFFTSTGIAILAAFYMSLYITIFFIIRWYAPPDPPAPSSKTAEGEEVPPKGEFWRELRVFAYRASRSLSVVLVVLLLGCLGASGKAIVDVREAMKLVGSDGIGGGLFLLLFALLFSFYSCLRDLVSPGGRTRWWIGFRCWCPNKFCGISRAKLPENGERGKASRVSDPPRYDDVGMTPQSRRDPSRDTYPPRPPPVAKKPREYRGDKI